MELQLATLSYVDYGATALRDSVDKALYYRELFLYYTVLAVNYVTL